MIDCYTWKTSNGRKATIMLEECGLEYTLHPIDISKDDQFTPEFIAINPNSENPGDHRYRRPGRRKPYTRHRVRRDPDVPGGEDRQVHAPPRWPSATRSSSG